MKSNKTPDQIYNKNCAKCSQNKGRYGDKVYCGFKNDFKTLEFESCLVSKLRPKKIKK